VKKENHCSDVKQYYNNSINATIGTDTQTRSKNVIASINVVNTSVRKSDFNRTADERMGKRKKLNREK
jgi:hypothetical protein